MTQYQPEDVLADLLYMRKGPGYTTERLRTRPALCTILGGKNESAKVLRERLESAIRSMHALDGDLLIDIFALGTTTHSTLARRRDAVGSLLGIGVRRWPTEMEQQ